MTIDEAVKESLSTYFQENPESLLLSRPSLDLPRLSDVVREGCDQIFSYLKEQQLDVEMYTYEHVQLLVFQVLFALNVQVSPLDA